MKEIGFVIGTRPEAIKLAPVIMALHQDLVQSRIIFTGQHREMAAEVFDVFGLQPDYDFALMGRTTSLTELAAGILNGMNALFSNWRPDVVVVQGDTTSALAGALAAFYEGITVAHVEAGLRTDSVLNPFPEEGNRRMIDRISSVFFAPTEANRQALLKEGAASSTVHVTGNTVIDALQAVVDPHYRFQSALLSRLDSRRPLIVVTAHRREHWGAPISSICAAINELAAQLNVNFVFAMHKNPALERQVRQELAGQENVYLLAAPSYREFANLLARCTFVLTDSGGLQEEAAALGKPVLVMRRSTERTEGVDSGILRLIGTEKKDIMSWVQNLINDGQVYQTMASAPNPFGDGLASRRICRVLEQL